MQCCKIDITETEPKKVVLKTYTCHEVRDNIDGWKELFRKKNKTDSVKKDPYYEAYCKRLDEFLAQCTCSKPSVGEKIQYAKEKREKGEGQW